MKMRDIMQIIEGVRTDEAVTPPTPNRPAEDVVHYYLSEGCGIFAYALWLAHGKPARGEIGIISRGDGEPWSRSIPFEVTHAFFELNERTIDVRGSRSISDMAEELYIIHDYEYQGSWLPDDFRRRFMGTSDRKPLYGDAASIQEALSLITTYPDFYGLPPAKVVSPRVV
jgi:hypothetical protein